MNTLAQYITKTSKINSGYMRCGIKNHPFIPNGWYLLHRVMWWHHTQINPKEKIVHHKDENKLNNEIDNLQLIDISLHQSLTNKGKPKNNGAKLRGNTNAKRLCPLLVAEVCNYSQEKHSAYALGKKLGISAQKVYYIWSICKK